MLLAMLAVLTTPFTAQAAGKLDRTVLPIPEPNYPAVTEFDVRKATAPPRFQVTAPKGAPNVLIVLIDDMGFGHSSAFGGPVQMPTVERLANNGLRYNHFHTTALCWPTRSGFDKFYGFIGGETNQWAPLLYDDLFQRCS
jgi:Sulfatase